MSRGKPSLFRSFVTVKLKVPDLDTLISLWDLPGFHSAAATSELLEDDQKVSRVSGAELAMRCVWLEAFVLTSPSTSGSPRGRWPHVPWLLSAILLW